MTISLFFHKEPSLKSANVFLQFVQSLYTYKNIIILCREKYTPSVSITISNYYSLYEKPFIDFPSNKKKNNNTNVISYYVLGYEQNDNFHV